MGHSPRVVESMTAIKSREFKHIFRKNAMLRELFLECVAVQCVLLFRAILGSRHSDDAEHIVGGTIQEAAIHFSKTAQEDYHSVRNQIADRWWYLVQQHREWRYKESLDALKDSTLAVHRKRVCELLSISSSLLLPREWKPEKVR
jgi:hypothetical protein